MNVKFISRSESPEFDTPEQLMVYCARVSSPRQTDENYEGLLAYCIKNQHWSIFELADMTVEITTTRAIAPQILRHRSFSFQEFCISGDSLITTLPVNGRTKKISIATLYKYQSDPRMKAIFQGGVRVFDEAKGVFIRATIKEVFKTGIKPLLKITLEDGKGLKSTKEHKFLTYGRGFLPLEELKVGDVVAVNGQELYRSLDWLTQAKQRSINNGTGVQGIANEAGVSYHTIRKWLKKLSIQFTHEEVSFYTEVWNKGISSELQPMAGKNHTEASRQKMQKSSRKGVDSNLYVNGNSQNVSWRGKIWQWQNKHKGRLINEAGNKCKLCGSPENLVIDHIIPCSVNRELAMCLDNLQIICSTCHKEKSINERKAARLTVRWKQIKSIESIGEEETYDIEVNHASHNYVANGIVVHNSQRYAKATGIEVYEARRQDVKNRQNSINNIGKLTKEWFEAAQEEVAELSFELYNQAIEGGIAKECARVLLPLGTTTKLYMKGSIRSWIHYLQIRTAEHTQKEHRDIALAIQEIFTENFPYTATALGWLGEGI